MKLVNTILCDTRTAAHCRANLCAQTIHAKHKRPVRIVQRTHAFTVETLNPLGTVRDVIAYVWR